MKLKRFNRYIRFMLVISFITLIFIKLTNSNIEDKPRAFIKSAEKSYILNSKKDAPSKGVRTSSKYGSSQVQLLPNPNIDLPIIIDLL